MSEKNPPPPTPDAAKTTPPPPWLMAYVGTGFEFDTLPETNGSPEIAIVGRSNVGKSSLVNFLSGQNKLARVSRTPGRTQAIHLFSVNDAAFYLVDLPGYGFALSPRDSQAEWARVMQVFFEKRKTLKAVMFLVDIRRTLNEEDLGLIAWFRSLGLRILIVQTKADKEKKSQWKIRAAERADILHLSSHNIVTVSTLSKLGLDLLKRALTTLVGVGSGG
jgi:GTP-binding protein